MFHILIGLLLLIPSESLGGLIQERRPAVSPYLELLRGRRSPPVPSSPRVKQLTELTDAQLRNYMDWIWLPQSDYEAGLCEIVIRGGPDWAAYLKKKLDLWADGLKKGGLFSDDAESSGPYSVSFGTSVKKVYDECERYGRNLELLTALRRVQKQPDPLQVVVVNADEIQSRAGSSPVFKVSLTNQDVERCSFGFIVGRFHPWRWRFKATDVITGKSVHCPGPRIMWYSLAYSRCPLDFGCSWSTSLRLGDYFDVIPSGEYDVRVQFSAEVSLSNRVDTQGSIIFESKPIRVRLRR